MSADIFPIAIPIAAVGSAIVSAISILLLAFRTRRQRALAKIEVITAEMMRRSEEVRQSNQFLTSVDITLNSLSDIKRVMDNVARLKEHILQFEIAQEIENQRSQRVLDLAVDLHASERAKLKIVFDDLETVNRQGRELRVDLLRNIDEFEQAATKVENSMTDKGSQDG